MDCEGTRFLLDKDGLLKDFKHEIEYCTFCPKMCRFACAVANTEKRETVTPTQKLAALYLLGKDVVSLEEIVDAVYKCCTCKACFTPCLHEIEVYKVLEAARAVIVDAGLAPKACEGNNRLVRQRNNPYGADLESELRGIVPEKYADRRAPVVFFPGCTAIVDRKENVVDTIRLLEAAGVDFGVPVSDAVCCGGPSFTLGYRDTFEYLAKRNVEIFRETSTVVSGCPMCVHSFAEEYPQYGLGLDAEVVHVAPFLLDLIEAGRLSVREPTGTRVVYHDPCHLGRHLGIYDAPRRLIELATGTEPGEFSYNRQDSVCCGGGGGLRLTSPGTARAMRSMRLDQIPETDWRHLATACPSCERVFSRASDEVAIVDVVNLVAQAVFGK